MCVQHSTLYSKSVLKFHLDGFFLCVPSFVGYSLRYFCMLFILGITNNGGHSLDFNVRVLCLNFASYLIKLRIKSPLVCQMYVING